MAGRRLSSVAVSWPFWISFFPSNGVARELGVAADFCRTGFPGLRKRWCGLWKNPRHGSGSVYFRPCLGGLWGGGTTAANQWRGSGGWQQGKWVAHGPLSCTPTTHHPSSHPPIHPSTTDAGTHTPKKSPDKGDSEAQSRPSRTSHTRFCQALPLSFLDFPPSAFWSLGCPLALGLILATAQCPEWEKASPGTGNW